MTEIGYRQKYAEIKKLTPYPPLCGMASPDVSQSLNMAMRTSLVKRGGKFCPPSLREEKGPGDELRFHESHFFFVWVIWSLEFGAYLVLGA